VFTILLITFYYYSYESINDTPIHSLVRRSCGHLSLKKERLETVCVSSIELWPLLVRRRTITKGSHFLIFDKHFYLRIAFTFLRGRVFCRGTCIIAKPIPLTLAFD